MSIEFIGFIGPRKVSEIHPISGPAFDHEYLRAFAQAHETAGFDRVLVGYYTNSPDNILVAAYAGMATTRLSMLLAHRPGFIAPSLAARKLATLDLMLNGRLAMHMISGGDDTDQKRDGDYLSHDERYARTEEYVEILKRIWTSEKPVSWDGRYYKFEGAPVEVRPAQQPRIPIYFGGSSDAAIDVAGRVCDVYMLWGETHEQVRETIARVRASAARYGRTVGFSVSFRPILAATEDEAWARAHRILEQTLEIRARGGRGVSNLAPGTSAGSQRLLEAAAKGPVLDKRLYTAIAAATGARGNTTALVGTPAQVADAILDYYDMGVGTILIRGFDPIEDALDYGRELIPMVRAEVARREAAAGDGSPRVA